MSGSQCSVSPFLQSVWVPSVMVLKTEASSLGHCESLNFPTRQAQIIPVSPSVQLNVWALVLAKSWRRPGHLRSVTSATAQSEDLLPQLFSWREERLSSRTQLLQEMSPPSIQPQQESPGTPVGLCPPWGAPSVPRHCAKALAAAGTIPCGAPPPPPLSPCRLPSAELLAPFCKNCCL